MSKTLKCPGGCNHTDKEHKAFDDGLQAGIDGIHDSHCPYIGELQFIWLIGHSVNYRGDGLDHGTTIEEDEAELRLPPAIQGERYAARLTVEQAREMLDSYVGTGTQDGDAQ